MKGYTMAQIKKQVASPLILLLVMFFSIVLVSSIFADTEKAKESFNKGLEYEKNGDKTAAMTAYRACVKEDPNYVDAYINMGSIHFANKEYEKALEMFKTASEKDPKNVDAFSNLGKVQYILRRYAEAEASFKSAIALSPSAELYENLGKVYYKKKNYKEVIDAFTKCHEAGGGDHITYYYLGRAYEKTGNTSQAKIAFNSSIKKKNNYNAHYALGSMYLSEEKFQNAASAFKAALKSSPTKYRAAYNYAIAVESGDPENYTENIKNWEDFIRIAKKNPKARQDVTVAEQHVKELKDAQEKANLQ